MPCPFNGWFSWNSKCSDVTDEGFGWIDVLSVLLGFSIGIAGIVLLLRSDP